MKDGNRPEAPPTSAGFTGDDGFRLPAAVAAHTGLQDGDPGAIATAGEAMG